MIRRLALCTLLSLFVTAVAAAQTTAPAATPATAPAGDGVRAAALMKSIPADCVGFAVARSTRSLLEGYKKAALAFTPPQMAGEIQQTDVLADMKREMGLGETFNADGAVAIVLMDPEKYGDPAVWGKAEDGPQQPTTRGSMSELDELRNWPIALVLPGSEPKKMFPNATMLENDGVFVVSDGAGDDWFIREREEGFVIVTPRRAILAAFDKPKAISGQLSKQFAAMLSENDAAAWLSVPAVKKLWSGGLGDQISGLMGRGGMGVAIMAQTVGPFAYVGFTRSVLFTEGQAGVVGITFADEGIKLTAREEYDAEGEIGKALAEHKESDKPLAASLGDLPYFFAYGSSKSFKTPAELKAKQWDRILASLKTTDAGKAVIKKQVAFLQEQVTGVEHYFGPVAEGSPTLGFVSVVHCKDAAAFIKALPEIGRAAEAGIWGIRLPFMGEDEAAMAMGGVRVRHMAGAERVGERSVDALIFDHPMMAQMPAEAREPMKKYLGEDKVQLLATQLDDDTVVLTFGGGVDMMSKAVEAADEAKDAIVSGPMAKASLAKLGKARPGILTLVNASNIYNYMTREMGGGRMLPAGATEPLAGTVRFDKGGWTFRGVVPFTAVKEVVRAASSEPVGGY